MVYEVIARKYRPQRFEEVVGQDHVIQTLRNAIDRGRIAHAYLFCGPRGTGKTTLARIFAKCLNCENGPSSAFSDEDPQCVEIAEGRSLDVIEIDGASNRGIDEIRELRETARYAPSSARFKVYIIDEVHMLTKEAFNALLKTLEEPPDHVKFMFATTEPEKVLPTILSRCQRFDLRRIPNPLIIAHLASIAEAEGVRIDDASLSAIARGADGGMRDAESTLDQLISFCGETIEEADALTMFGLTSRTSLLKVVDTILDGDGGGALSALEELTRNGKDLGRFLGDLLELFRSLLTHALCEGHADYLGLSAEDAEALTVRSAKVDSHALARIVEALLDAENSFRMATSKRIAVEIGLMRAIEARSAIDINEALERLRALREGADPLEGLPGKSEASVPREPARQPAPAPEPEASRLPPQPPQPTPLPKRATQPQSAEPTAPRPTVRSEPVSTPAPTVVSSETSGTPPESDLFALWERLMETLRSGGGFVASFLLEAHPVEFQDGVLVIGFEASAAPAMEMADTPRVQEAILEALSALELSASAVRFSTAPRPPGWVPPAPPEPDPIPPPEVTRSAAGASEVVEAPRAPEPEPVEPIMIDPEKFRQDPLIQEALTQLKARIVDVRPAKT